MSSYETCKHNIMRQIITEYNEKKLKMKNNEIIKNKKQAIAIGLKQSENKCKYNKEDIIKLLEKVNKDLNDIKKKINLSNIIETKIAIKILNKKRKGKQKNIFKKLLMNKIILSQKNKEELSHNIWEELEIINNL